MIDAPAAPAAFGILATFENGQVWAFERCHGGRKRNFGKAGPMGGWGVSAWSFPSPEKALAKVSSWIEMTGSEAPASVVVLPIEEVEEKAREAWRKRMAAVAEARDRKFVVETYGKWVAGGKDLSVNKWGTLNDYNARVLVSNGVMDQEGKILPGKPLSIGAPDHKAEEWLKEAGLL